MPARSVCLVTLSLSEAGPGRFGRQVSVTDIYHTVPCFEIQLVRNSNRPCAWAGSPSAWILFVFAPNKAKNGANTNAGYRLIKSIIYLMYK